MHLQCTMSSIFDLRSTSIGHARHVKTQHDNGLRIWIFSQKLPFSVGKKLFQRQIKEVQYTICIRHITNISDLMWFQRSCGSMKSVSSFSSIDNQCQKSHSTIFSLFSREHPYAIIEIFWRHYAWLYEGCVFRDCKIYSQNYWEVGWLIPVRS